ncbi:hypothetical protein LBMAG42_57220 [Deltaproteobacteria bacterium]|nr:hypothetical protein LBMAG42_57220 [Deltaproteobacteria bacterium]
MRNWSHHADERASQRAIPRFDVELALTWGKRIRQFDGRTAYHLGRREADEAREQGAFVPQGAIGVAVVIADDETVITVVRSHDRRRLSRAGWREAVRRTAGGRP